jgi:hypothetical protein
VIHSARAWGFVHPLQDRSLGQQVVNHWPDLLQMVVPREKNLVKAGGFDGDCLSLHNEGPFWRVADSTDWNATRQIALDRPLNQPDNSTLLLTNLDQGQCTHRIRCHQPLVQGPPPGAIVVLRYRARSLNSKGSLAVYVVMPAEIPEGETGPIANRVRAVSASVLPKPDDPIPNRWRYWSPAWVTPTDKWQTYLVVFESPPFPTRLPLRNLVIELTATRPAAADQVWVDDVELFVWQLGSKP